MTCLESFPVNGFFVLPFARPNGKEIMISSLISLTAKLKFTFLTALIGNREAVECLNSKHTPAFELGRMAGERERE